MSRSAVLALSQVQRIYVLAVACVAVLGIVVSSYATWHHLTYLAEGATDALCNINARWSCDDIAASPYSEFLGFPLGVWGVAYFVILLGLAGVVLPTKPLTQRVQAHVAALVHLSFLGFAVSVVLAIISFFIIHAFCITCSLVYALTTVLAGAGLYVVLRHHFPLRLKGEHAPWSGLVSAAILMVITLAGYAQVVAPAPLDPTEHPDHPVQNELRRQGESLGDKAPTEVTLKDVGLEHTVHELMVNRSPYSGLGEDYRLGSDSAKVTVVEFADFQCGACQRMSGIIHALHRQYGERVSFVFKNYPLSSACNNTMRGDLHPKACDLAVLGRCAGVMGKFWTFHDLVFAQQDQLRDDLSPADLARRVDMTNVQIEQCLQNKDFAAKVKDDIALGTRVGVEATPSLFFNGKRYVGKFSAGAMAVAINFLLRSSLEASDELESESVSEGETAPEESSPGR